MNEENKELNAGEIPDIVTSEQPEEAQQIKQPNKILIASSVAIVVIIGFLFVNNNRGPSEEQCDRVMLTQIFFDGRISAVNSGLISSLDLLTAWNTGLEDLGNAVEDLSGDAKAKGDEIFNDAAGVGISLSTGSSLAQSYYKDMTTGYEDFDATYCK